LSKEANIGTHKKRLRPGDIVADRYRIVEVAGEGGVAVVYKALNVQTSKTVALKMLHNADAGNPQNFKRFQQEAKASSLLNHPHIVAIHDFGIVDEDQAYLAMDFLEGRNMQAIIRDQKCLSIDRFIHIFVQVCDALQHAHSQGVIHRDIKPSNFVLINKNNDKDFVVVVDFGLVKLMSQMNEDPKLTMVGEVLGSPLYMSPEQCRCVDVDHRSDIYSLGCVMFHALSGFPPFMGSSPMDTMYMHGSKEALPIQEVNPNVLVPPAIERVVLKAMAKSPQLRYQTMAQLKTALQEAHYAAGNHGKNPESLPGASTVAAAKDFSNIIKGTRVATTSKPASSAHPPLSKQKITIWSWLGPAVITLVVAFAGTWLVVNKLVEQDRTRIEKMEQFQAQEADQVVHRAKKRRDKLRSGGAGNSHPQANDHQQPSDIHK